MITKLTKEVTERLKSFESLQAAVVEQGPEVAAAVRSAAPPVPLPDPEAAPAAGTPAEDSDTLGTLNACTRSLQGSINKAVAYDRQLFDLTSEEGAQRKIRDDSMDLLGKWFVGLRRTTLGQYADPDLSGLGLRPPNPTEPMAFQRIGELVVEKLGSEERTRLLESPLFATAHDPGDHAVELDVPVGKLRNALTSLRTFKRRIDAVLEKKYEILETYDREELRASRMFEDLCHFAGKPGLAKRVRPTVRRLKKDDQELVFTDQVVADPTDRDDAVGSDSAGDPSETAGTDAA
jgi:hypothetical protein